MEIPRQFQRLFFHVSPRENRTSIETYGLVANTPKLTVDEAPRGVYLSSGTPNTQYGTDIYGVARKKGVSIRQDPTSYLEYYSPRSIAISDFKRIGHVFNNNGAAEIHWHKEEECPNASK